MAGKEDVERFGGGYQDVRRPADHRGAVALRGVAGADQHANLREERVHPRQLAERHLQVFLHVIAQRSQRGHIQDLRLVLQIGSLMGEGIDRGEIAGERFAHAGGR